MLGPFFECTLHQLEQESSAPALAEVLQCELREATVGEPRRVLTQPASPYNTPLLHYNFTNIDCMPGPFFECTLHQLEQEDFVSSLAEVTNNADTVHLHMCGTCQGLHFARPDTSNSAHGFCQAPFTHCIKPLEQTHCLVLIQSLMCMPGPCRGRPAILVIHLIRPGPPPVRPAFFIFIITRPGRLVHGFRSCGSLPSGVTYSQCTCSLLRRYPTTSQTGQATEHLAVLHCIAHGSPYGRCWYVCKLFNPTLGFPGEGPKFGLSIVGSNVTAWASGL